MMNSQSEALIDVSRERTPSPTTNDNKRLLVEDSLKDNPDVYQGGAVQTPKGPLLENEEDELYHETPEAKNRRIAREASNQNLSISKEASTITAEDSRTTEVQDCGTSQTAPPVDQSLAANTNGDSAANHVPIDEAKALTPQIHSRKEQQETLKAPKTSQASTMPKSKAKSGLSALEALRARRNGFTLPEATSTQAAAKSAPSIPVERQQGEPKCMDKAKAKEPDSQIAKQPLLESTQNGNQTRSAVGELQACKGKASVSTRSNTTAVAQQTVRDEDSNNTDELVKDTDHQTERRSKLSTVRPVLKTPKQNAPPRDSPGSSTYDLVESPESVESAQPNGGTKTSKKKLATSGRSSMAASASRPRRGRATRVAGQSRAGVQRQSEQREQPKSVAGTRKERMKAESNIEQAEVPETSTKTKQKKKATPTTQPQRRAGLISRVSKARTTTKPTADDGDCGEDDAERVLHVKPRTGSEAGLIAPTRPSKEQTDQADLTDRKIGTAHPQAGSRKAIEKQRAKTPILLASSPPPSTVATAKQMKKPTIISFSRSGPQNQGPSSIRKIAPAPPQTACTSVQPQPGLPLSNTKSHTKLQGKLKRKTSSPASYDKPRQSKVPKAHTNVAKDMTNALAGFKTAIEIRSEDIPRLADDDDEYLHIDDFDSTTMMAVQDEALERSPGRDSIERTHLQREMAPPPALNTTQSTNAGNVSLPPTHGARELRYPTKANESAALNLHPPTKRAHDTENSRVSAPKRSRMSIHQPSKSDELRKASMKPIESLIEQRKPVLPVTTTKNAHEPIKGTTQKPNRERSHGSQKVDMQGSPIPPGMVVQDRETVLEQFSQQARLSSDGSVTSQTLEEQTTHGIKTNVKMHPPPALPHQAERMSSNKKRNPSGPEDESRGVTKAIKTDHNLRLVLDEASAPSTDPFTSVSADRKQSGGDRSSSALFNQLEEQIQRETVTRLREHPSAPQIAEEAVASLSRNPFKRFAHKDVTTDVTYAKHDDPDRTLVEREPDLRFNLSSRAVSISTDSSASSVSSTDRSKPIDDVAVWRSALQPHQMNLFDGLVIVSHKLVRHLADQETAQNDIADDYQRRGMNIIEQMELLQAKEYQNVVKRIKSSRKRFRQELVRCSKALQRQVADIKTMSGERKEAYANRESLEDRLQSLMDAVC